MAERVPYQPFPTVNPVGTSNDYEQIHSDPGMFGGLIAQGEEKLGQGMEQAGVTGLDVATTQQRLDNTVHSAEIMKWQSGQGTDALEKFRELRGRAPRDALADYKKQQDALSEQAIAQAGSPEEKAAVAKGSKDLVERFYSWGSSHASTEYNAYASKTMVDGAANSAALAGLEAEQPVVNQQAMAAHLKQSDDQVISYLWAQHQDETTIEYERSKNLGKNLKVIIENKAVSGDVQQAKHWFDQYQNQIDPQSRLEIARALTSKLNPQIGKALGDMILGRRPDAENFTYAEQSAGLPKGTIGGMISAESGFRPDAKAGSHTGLVQGNAEWNRRYGVTDPKDFSQVTNALVTECEDNRTPLTRALGRPPTPADYWLAHNLGLGGAIQQLKNPDKPAWQNMLDTAEGRAKGSAWAKAAIWGNLPKSQQDYFGSVDKVTGALFTGAKQITFQRAGQQVPYVDKAEAYRRLDALLTNDNRLYKPVKAYLDGEINFQTQVNAERVSQIKRDVPDIIDAIRDGHTDLQLPSDLALIGPAEAGRFQEQAAFAQFIGTMRKQLQFASPQEEREWQATINANLGAAGEGMHPHRHAATTGPGVVTDENLNAADAAMQLTPQEKFLYQMHLKKMTGPGGVDNSDGSRSTLLQAVEEHNGRYYNVPTVWNGKIETQKFTQPGTGKIFDIPNRTAMENIERTGWDKFPSYATPEEADARYEKMHAYLEKDTGAYLHPAVETEGPGEPPSESFAALYKQQKQAAAANEVRRKEKEQMLTGPNADPAQYTQSHPSVAGPFAAVGAAIRSGDPKAASAAYERYAFAQLDLQSYLGVPDDQQHVLTRLNAISTTEAMLKSQDPQLALKQQKDMSGKAWPSVYRDLVTMGGLPPSFQAINLLGNDPASAKDAALLSTYLREAPKDIKELEKNLGGPKPLADIRTNIAANTTVKAFDAAMEEQGLSVAQRGGMINAIEQLAQAKILFSQGGPQLDAATAANAAAAAITGRFNFDAVPGKVMIPNAAAPTVAANARVLLRQLAEHPENLNIPSSHYLRPTGEQWLPEQMPTAADQPHGLLPAQTYVDLIHANPHWVTNPAGNGMLLRDSDYKLVRYRDGSPVEVRFDAPLHPEALDVSQFAGPEGEPAALAYQQGARMHLPKPRPVAAPLTGRVYG
jgi:hypothetical protein